MYANSSSAIMQFNIDQRRVLVQSRPVPWLNFVLYYQSL